MEVYCKMKKSLFDQIAKEDMENILVEIDEHQEMAGFNTWNTISTSTCIAVSHFVGNDGKVCTYTVECVNNCR